MEIGFRLTVCARLEKYFVSCSGNKDHYWCCTPGRPLRSRLVSFFALHLILSTKVPREKGLTSVAIDQLLKFLVANLPKLSELTPFYFRPKKSQSKHSLVDPAIGST